MDHPESTLFSRSDTVSPVLPLFSSLDAFSPRLSEVIFFTYIRFSWE